MKRLFKIKKMICKYNNVVIIILIFLCKTKVNFVFINYNQKITFNLLSYLLPH